VITRKSAAELDVMATAGRIVVDTIALLGEHIRPGVTTEELDHLAEDHIRSRGGYPTFLGYPGPYPYPAATCLSLNEVIVHGIPGEQAVSEGDVLSVDVGVTYDGFVADSAYTFRVGEVDAEADRLLETCEAALWAGIEKARAGAHLSDVSHAIQAATEDAGFSVVRSLVGHGVGRNMHEDPQIPNFGEPGRGPVLAPGMTLAIEPMITAGGPEVVVRDDRWTIATRDGRGAENPHRGPGFGLLERLCYHSPLGAGRAALCSLFDQDRARRARLPCGGNGPEGREDRG
jgi:methionyl aminopeptidase